MLAKKGEPSARPTASAILDSVPSDLTLGDQIGKGSYGSVYSAMFVGRRVAVKAVPVEDGEDGDALRGELQTEIKMLKECDSQWDASAAASSGPQASCTWPSTFM